MPEITLVAESGRDTGSRSSRRLRTSGRIPGVVYGHGADPIPISVAAREFRLAVSGDAGLNTLLDLELDGTRHLTLARDVQRHPVRGVVTHIDFQIVRRDEVIAADVPVNLVGDPVEVNHGDGIVEQLLFSLPVKAKPADIPTVIDLDISGLEIGSSLRVADLPLPRGAEADVDLETIVVSGLPPRVQTAGEGGEGAGEAESAGAPAEPPSEG
ncbi:MAG: 50S ribosomal protein L25 [Actinomycetota bacterium]|jgi:large subunit ribosomal protein L25|nr:50S ribosomal protein L25 [Actinomycetota bacterium]